jgi:hypothetical protein
MTQHVGEELTDREIASRRRAGGNLERYALGRFDALRDGGGRKKSDGSNCACHETQKSNMSLRSHRYLIYSTLKAALIGPIAAFDEMTPQICVGA